MGTFNKETVNMTLTFLKCFFFKFPSTEYITQQYTRNKFTISFIKCCMICTLILAMHAKFIIT